MKTTIRTVEPPTSVEDVLRAFATTSGKEEGYYTGLSTRSDAFLGTHNGAKGIATGVAHTGQPGPAHGR
jgi:hypothetical protein